MLTDILRKSVPNEVEERSAFLALREEGMQRDLVLGRFWMWLFVVHAVLALIWISLLSLIGGSGSRSAAGPGVLWPQEFQPVAEAVVYRTEKFGPAQVRAELDESNPYRGPPTIDTNVAWWHLYDVGFVVATQQQAATLGRPTENASVSDQRPLLQLDVFHQLHCLDSIRLIAYNSSPWDMSEAEEQAHLDHCIEYLRQVVMCHSDVTPILNIPRIETRKPGQPPWKPDFETVHTCRDFQKIHDWAARVNTSGFIIDLYPGVGTRKE